MAKKRKNRGGRPKGSTMRGPTRQVGLRLSEDLWKKIETLRSQTAELKKTRTEVVEELMRAGLDASLVKT